MGSPTATGASNGARKKRVRTPQHPGGAHEGAALLNLGKLGRQELQALLKANNSPTVGSKTALLRDVVRLSNATSLDLEDTNLAEVSYLQLWGKCLSLRLPTVGEGPVLLQQLINHLGLEVDSLTVKSPKPARPGSSPGSAPPGATASDEEADRTLF